MVSALPAKKRNNNHVSFSYVHAVEGGNLLFGELGAD